VLDFRPFDFVGYGVVRREVTVRNRVVVTLRRRVDVRLRQGRREDEKRGGHQHGRRAGSSHAVVIIVRAPPRVNRVPVSDRSLTTLVVWASITIDYDRVPTFAKCLREPHGSQSVEFAQRQ
jgi:hypothetical protein